MSNQHQGKMALISVVENFASQVYQERKNVFKSDSDPTQIATQG